MKKYWIVFAIFVPIGFALKIYDDFSIASLFGLSSVYNGEWWYVRQYIVMMMLSPFLCCFGDLLKYKNKVHWIICTLILVVVTVIVSVGVQYVTNLVNHVVYRNYLIIFCLGYIVAISEIYEKIANLFNKHKTIELVLAIIGVIVCFIVRSLLADSASYSTIDIVLVAPFIYCMCVIFDKCKPIGKSMYFLGKYSVYMWLVHTFYCYYYFQEFITISKISTVMFIELFVVSLLTAIVLAQIERLINFIIRRIKNLELWDKLKSRNAL